MGVLPLNGRIKKERQQVLKFLNITKELLKAEKGTTMFLFKLKYSIRC